MTDPTGPYWATNALPERSTVPAPRPVPGCTEDGCGTQRTVLLHPEHGRRCPAHATLPPGGFRSDLAADMVELGYTGAAFAYLRAFLAAEIGRRFAAVRVL